MQARVCGWCGRPIVLTVDGWVHEKGLTAYWQNCKACPWQGPQPGNWTCPDCGGELIDHHCVLLGEVAELLAELGVDVPHAARNDVAGDDA